MRYFWGKSELHKINSFPYYNFPPRIFKCCSIVWVLRKGYNRQLSHINLIRQSCFHLVCISTWGKFSLRGLWLGKLSVICHFLDIYSSSLLCPLRFASARLPVPVQDYPLSQTTAICRSSGVQAWEDHSSCACWQFTFPHRRRGRRVMGPSPELSRDSIPIGSIQFCPVHVALNRANT